MQKLRKIQFEVLGEPVSKLRARAWRGYFVTPQKTREHEARIKLHAEGAMLEAGLKNCITGRVLLRLLFYVRRPLSKPDLSNLVKCVEDAMNGVVYKDDSQVALILAAKHQANATAGQERTLVTIMWEGQ